MLKFLYCHCRFVVYFSVYQHYFNFSNHLKFSQLYFSLLKLFLGLPLYYYISLFENSKIAFSNFMLNFAAFFNSDFYDDCYRFPKSELGVFVLIIPILFISELLKRNAKTQKNSKKVIFLNWSILICLKIGYRWLYA